MKELLAVDIERRMCQFCTMILKTINFSSKAAHNELYQKGKLEVNFSELSHTDARKLLVEDNYFNQEIVFNVHGVDVVVKNSILADALKELPKQKRTIILLKYFLAWTDKEIGEHYETERATIHFRRNSTLKMLKKMLMENSDYERN